MSEKGLCALSLKVYSQSEKSSKLSILASQHSSFLEFPSSPYPLGGSYFIGGFISIGIFAYSGGPYPLSYHGLGDVAVLVFFGWIPTLTSFYILRGTVSDSTIWHLATAIGLASVNILVVNNYRDVEEDRKAGKQTLIVRWVKTLPLAFT